MPPCTAASVTTQMRLVQPDDSTYEQLFKYGFEATNEEWELLGACRPNHIMIYILILMRDDIA